MERPAIFFDSSEAGAFASVFLKYVVLILAFVLVFRYARHIDHDWFETVLADQPADVVTPGEMEALRSVHARRAVRKAARRAGGAAESRRLADLQEAQLRLATLLGIYPDGRRPSRSRSRSCGRSARSSRCPSSSPGRAPVHGRTASRGAPRRPSTSCAATGRATR
ncbi:hypothetical protein NKG05_11635 [Oerskovia sp. M15]